MGGPCDPARTRPRRRSRRGRDPALEHEFFIEGSDFANAGMVSTEVKSILKKIGFDPKLIRRVAISTYEGEMNVVMHAQRAKVTLHGHARASSRW